jgi:serine protease Do
LIGALPPGATAKIEVVRDLKPLVIPVPLSERRDSTVVVSLPQAKTEIKLGLDVQDLTAGLADKFKLRESHGVLITKVDAGSLAQAEGLREGDLIKEVNRSDVGSMAEFTAALAKVRRGDTVLLRVLRENRAFYVVLKSTE